MAGFKEYQMLFSLNASVGSGYKSTFETGQSSISQMQDKINALNKTQGDISSYTKQQSAIDKTKAKIDLYQTQLANLQNATAATSKEEAELANAIAAKEQQLNNANEKLAQQNAALSQTGEALRNAGVDTNNLASESERLKGEAEDVAKAQKEEAAAAQQAGKSLKDAMEGARAAIEAAGLVAAMKSIYTGLIDCSTAAAHFETAMAGVKRTVGGDDDFIAGLGETFKELSTQMPITANELAGIATTAGQLGIAQENVEGFTMVMAKLATTTDLSADNAATMLAQFSNITGVTDYDRLGSTVAQLGDATATTASKVVEMSQGMAASASIAGMSSTDILAISAAVGSLGIEAASGSTSMSTLISTLYKATETGDKLEDFASVAGMTGEEFKTAWGENAVGALDAFIQGLNDTERNGRSAVVILDELGIKNVRQTKAILGLAQAGGLLSNTVRQANQAWNENSALAEKASVMYGTTEAKLTMMQNAANNVAIAVGDALNPALSWAYETVTSLMEPFSEWLSANPALVQGITAFVTVLGVATAAVVGYTAVTKLAAAASAIFSASIPGLGIILGVAAAVGLLTAGLSALRAATDESAESFEDLDDAYDEMTAQVKHQDDILDLVDDYNDLNGEVTNLNRLLAKDFTAEVSITPKGPDDSDKLTKDDFVSDTEVELTAGQVKSLLAAGFMRDDDPGITITADQTAELYKKGFLRKNDPGITITARQIADLTRSGFLRKNDPGITLTAKQVKELKAEGFLDPEDGGIKLTANQNKTLKSLGFMAENDEAITLTADQTATLYERGFFAADDPGITLTADQSAQLYERGFFASDDKGITLTAAQTATLTAKGFLLPDEYGVDVVSLTALAAAKVKASDFMENNESVTITGAAGNTLTAADFGLSNQTITYLATMDEPSLKGVKETAENLKSQITEVDSQLATAQLELNTSINYAEQLHKKIDGEKNGRTKTALKQKLEEVNATIKEQQDEVDALEARHINLTSEYGVVSQAAEELQGKEEQLNAAKQALASSSEIVAAAANSEAAAFDAAAQAARKQAEADRQMALMDMYKNITSQTQAYAKSIKTEQEARDKVAAAQTRQANAQAILNSENDAGLDNMINRVLTLNNEIQNAEEYDPIKVQQLYDSSEALFDLMETLTGIRFNMDQLTDPEYRDYFDDLAGSQDELMNAYVNSGNAIESYNSQIEAADKLQQSYIDNLTNAMLLGITDETRLRKLLTEAFKDEVGGAQMVEDIMEQVISAYNEATDAAEEYAEATEEITEGSEDEHRSVDAIIDDLKNLQKEYDDAYNSAYKSMDGQFKLFEDAKQKIKEMHDGFKGGMKGMTSGLESQTKYVENYTANYTLAQQKLAAAGVSAETTQAILASLSDGSAESGAALESIATGSEADAKKLGEAYEALGAAKEEYASTVADMETNFSEEMTKLQTELAETIAAMDQSTEAAENAKATLDAYVDAADGYVALAAAKYSRVAAAAVAALKKEFITLGLDVPGFAGGTGSAPRGLAWVGEEGPELMWFNGGERVMSHEDSVNYAEQSAKGADMITITGRTAGGEIKIEYAPVYNFSGGMTSEEVKLVFEEHASGMRDEIERILEEIQEDEERRALA